jgi:hypothetical protein
LAVVEFVGADDLPIAVYMNYAMHLVNYYMMGVISADFPGEAARYVEELFDNKPVAVFSNGAEGDQNPRLAYTAPFRFRQPAQPRPAQAQPGQPQPGQAGQPATGFNPRTAAAWRQAVAPENLAAYKKAIARTGDYVVMLRLPLGDRNGRPAGYERPLRRIAHGEGDVHGDHSRVVAQRLRATTDVLADAGEVQVVKILAHCDTQCTGRATSAR